MRYAQLPESQHFREALARSLGLEPHADYCAIADKFLADASDFMDDVGKQQGISAVNWGFVSLTEFVG